jgi:hypothetical protein
MRKTDVQKHFDEIAGNYDYYTGKRKLHYSTLKKLIRKLIGENKKVLEIGCGTGDLLYYLKPKHGYGVDISSQMIRIAGTKYQKSKNLKFSTTWPKEKFDFIFMSDVVEHLEEREEVFRRIAGLMKPGGLFVNTMMNPVWIPVEFVYNLFGWKMPEGPHKRVAYSLLKTEIERAGMKIVSHDYTLLMPVRIPLVTHLLNTYLENLLRRFAFIEFFVCKTDHFKKQ